MVLQISFYPHPHTQKTHLIHVPPVAANTYALSLAKVLTNNFLLTSKKMFTINSGGITASLSST